MVGSVALLASGLAAVYTSSLAYAGFLGLAALWASSQIGHGGYRGHGGYGGYGGYGGHGGYGGYGGHEGLGGHGGAHGHGEKDKEIGAHFKIGKYKLKKGKKVGGKYIGVSFGAHLGKQKSGHTSQHVEKFQEGYKCEPGGGYGRGGYGNGCNKGNLYGTGHSGYGRWNSAYGSPNWNSNTRNYIKKTGYGTADQFGNKKMIPSSGPEPKDGLLLNSVSEQPESPNGFVSHPLDNRSTSLRSHFVASAVDTTETFFPSTTSVQDGKKTEHPGRHLDVSKPEEIAFQRVGVNRRGDSSSESSPDSESSWLPMKEPEEERLLRSIRESDTNNCGLRLVCELAAIRNRPLTREEWEILQFVSYGDEYYDRVYPGEGLRPNSNALHDYQEAAYFGKWGGACAERFQSCPVSAHVMMVYIMELLPTVQNF